MQLHKHFLYKKVDLEQSGLRTETTQDKPIYKQYIAK